MADKDSTTLIHPATQQILNLKAACEAYLLNGKYIPAFETMGYLIGSMHPDDKDILSKNSDKKLIDVIRTEEKWFRTVKSRRSLDFRIKHCQFKYRDWLDRIVEQLHRKGYLDGSKFKPAKPAAGDKKSGKGDHQPLPGVMSSRIEKQ